MGFSATPSSSKLLGLRLLKYIVTPVSSAAALVCGSFSSCASLCLFAERLEDDLITSSSLALLKISGRLLKDSREFCREKYLTAMWVAILNFDLYLQVMTSWRRGWQ